MRRGAGASGGGGSPLGARQASGVGFAGATGAAGSFASGFFAAFFRVLCGWSTARSCRGVIFGTLASAAFARPNTLTTVDRRATTRS